MLILVISLNLHNYVHVVSQTTVAGPEILYRGAQFVESQSVNCAFYKYFTNRNTLTAIRFCQTFKYFKMYLMKLAYVPLHLPWSPRSTTAATLSSTKQFDYK